MALTEQDREWVRMSSKEGAYDAAKEVMQEMLGILRAECRSNRSSCSVRSDVADMKSQAKGAKALGVLIVGAVGFAGTVLGAIATWLTLRGRP